MQFWSKDEYLRFSEAVMDKPDAWLAFEVLFWTGLREGEMLALTPSDIDLARSRVSVTKTYQRLHREDVVGPPKTERSRRDVEHQELRLRFQSCRWELVGRVSQEEIEEREVPECVVAVLAFALSAERWSGTASALAEAVGVVGVSPAVLGKRVAQHSGFLGERGVSVRREHTRGGNVITLLREGSEGCEGTPGAPPLPSLPSQPSPPARPAPLEQQLLPGF